MAKYKFETAEKKDIPAMVEIEELLREELFEEYSDDEIELYDKKFMEKWYKHNPDMFKVVKDDNDAVKGFIIIAPITEELHYDICEGKICDMSEFPKEGVCKTMDSDYINVADIGMRSKERNMGYIRALAALAQGTNDLIYEVAKVVTAFPVSNHGKSWLEHMGFQKIGTKENGNYILEVSEKAYNDNKIGGRQK